ncbi:unnamed protein product [Effrenium voratum]|nr:unnamed protein product [Effrenium voratum]
MLWDSAGKQPSSGLAPCRPEVVMDKSTHGFPRLTTTMNCVDDFILKGLSSRVSRLAGLAERSDAMVSIYENGSRFQKHVDNPNQDGRVLTSIVYLNTGDPWKAEDDGGQLRMFLDGEPPIDLMPDTGRMVLFWADRIPHEVLPSKRRRMALTYWMWFDRQEREAKVRQLGDAETQLQTKEERLAQEFIAFMLSETSKCEDIAQRAQALPKKSLDVVATVVGASNAKDEALEGIQRLSQEDLERLRNSMGKMGL